MNASFQEMSIRSKEELAARKTSHTAYILPNPIALMERGQVTCSTRKRSATHSDPGVFSQPGNTTFEALPANNAPAGLTERGYKSSNQQLLC